MTRIYAVACATAALLFAGVSASYDTNAAVPYRVDMDCTACIRSGFTYCINGTSQTEATNWNCSYTPVQPAFIMPEGGKPNGYVCSNALDDQMNAIINGCRPFIPDELHRGPCGDYIIDLTTESVDQRIIGKFPAGTACTYRVISKCGYPVAIPNVRNPVFAGDYNIAYGTLEGLDAAEELNGWEFTQALDWTGTFNTGDASNAFKLITNGPTQPMVSDLNKCDLKTQNLYVTITRNKQSKSLEAEDEEFLSLEPRQLQALTPDFELGFSLTAGNAKFLGAISFAAAALIAMFAF